MAEFTYSSPATFEKELTESLIPCLIDFWAHWCGPCKMLAPVMEKLEKEFEGRIRVIKVNVDEYPELTSYFGVRSIPAVIFFARGKKQWSEVGAMPERHYRKKIWGSLHK